MGLVGRLMARWRTKRSPADSNSDLLALAKSMHPNAPDSALIAYLLEHAPEEDAPPLPNPLDHETIDVAAHLTKEFNAVARKLEHNSERLRDDTYPVAQKRNILAGSIRMLNRLYALEDGLTKCAERPEANRDFLGRARQVENDLSIEADKIGFGLNEE